MVLLLVGVVDIVVNPKPEVVDVSEKVGLLAEKNGETATTNGCDCKIVSFVTKKKKKNSSTSSLW